MRFVVYTAFAACALGCGSDSGPGADPDLDADVVSGTNAEKIAEAMRPSMVELVAMARNPGQKTSFLFEDEDRNVHEFSAWYDTAGTRVPSVVIEVDGARLRYSWDLPMFGLRATREQSTPVSTSKQVFPGSGKRVQGFDLMDLFSGADFTFIVLALAGFVGFTVGAWVLGAVAGFIKLALLVGIFVWALGNIPVVLEPIANLVKEFFEIAGWDMADVNALVERVVEAFGPIIDAIARGLS